MNWIILIIALVVVALLSSMCRRAVTITPNSTCQDFISATDAILSRDDLSTLSTETRAQMCKIPSYQLKMGQCPEYDWVVAKNKMFCDTSTEQGSLTLDGVRVWI